MIPLYLWIFAHGGGVLALTSLALVLQLRPRLTHPTLGVWLENLCEAL